MDSRFQQATKRPAATAAWMQAPEQRMAQLPRRASAGVNIQVNFAPFSSGKQFYVGKAPQHRKMT
jgi:hypothetical protein